MKGSAHARAPGEAGTVVLQEEVSDPRQQFPLSPQSRAVTLRATRTVAAFRPRQVPPAFSHRHSWALSQRHSPTPEAQRQRGARPQRQLAP